MLGIDETGSYAAEGSKCEYRPGYWAAITIYCAAITILLDQCYLLITTQGVQAQQAGTVKKQLSLIPDTK